MDRAEAIKTLERIAGVGNPCKPEYRCIDMEWIQAAQWALDEIAELRRCLEVSEDLRRAYEAGKLELYAMGGEICDAASKHLPCGEGPLNRKANHLLGVAGLKAIIVEQRMALGRIVEACQPMTADVPAIEDIAREALTK